ncbi:hypothetical protein BD293_4311 [Roseinatronobacter monicus]|uniref:Uncharacterized protein n=1 Tax=Roseinatronobacter monicus TaxID=393481 RepID=A0A543K4J6_9RHOB|nr:hypothetical protein BD293_4311 [Roseinatronobacter monicus]
MLIGMSVDLHSPSHGTRQHREGAAGWTVGASGQAPIRPDSSTNPTGRFDVLLRVCANASISGTKSYQNHTNGKTT